MGTNYHTAWTTATKLRAAEMTPPLAALDKAITYQRNVIIHCDGDLSYDKSTGVFSWSAALGIIYIREDGQAIANSVNAGSITLADNEFAYVDRSETNNATVTVAKAAVTTGSASNFLTIARIVLGYRNSTSDEFYAVGICHPVRKIGAAIADANAAYTTGGLDTEAEIIAAVNATNGKLNSILAVLRERKVIAT